MAATHIARPVFNDELSDSMRGIAKSMQLVGLTAPPLAIVLQLSESISLGQMLTVLVASVCLFWIGRIMEGYSRS